VKSFLKFVAVTLIVLVLSVLLPPLLFDFLPFKFERIFNRLVMIFTLVAVFLFVRIRKQTIRQYGLRWHRDSTRFLLTGFLAGLIILILLTVVRIFFGSAQWAPMPISVLDLAVKAAKIMAAAFLIALIEEFFFRGFIYSTLRDRFSWNVPASVGVTSLFYSLIHFVDKESPYIGPDPVWTDSLKLVTSPFLSLAHWPEIWPAAVGLFIFGIVLNDARIRTGSLFPSIGMHAGCVFFIKMDGIFIDFFKGRLLVFGGPEIYDGLLGWIFLVALGGIMRMMLKKRKIA